MELPYFGVIDLKNDFFETEFTNSKGEVISISIDFDGENPKKSSLKSIKSFLENLENNIDKIKSQLLTSNFIERVNEYINYHLEELKSEPKIEKINSQEQFIDELKVQSVNIYPTVEERFFSFDFTIDDELTNDLLVVDLLNDLSISYITTES